MKQRAPRALNIFALSLLLFAAYLNFVKKDNEASPQSFSTTILTRPSKRTVLVKNPEQYLKKTEQQTK